MQHHSLWDGRQFGQSHGVQSFVAAASVAAPTYLSPFKIRFGLDVAEQLHRVRVAINYEFYLASLDHESLGTCCC
jgi:hypothetical protein